MERLTTNYRNCNQIVECDNDMCHETCNKFRDCTKCPINKAINKLADYEDAEEQGLLLRMPCKVGDSIYDIDFNRVDTYTITGFSYGTAEDYIDNPLVEDEVICYYRNFNGSITGSFPIRAIGDSVFLTEAEAEAALQAMQESEGKHE